MKLTWIGHSCFKIEEGGYTIITDPSADGKVPGLKNVREEADLVLCSHEHFDHNARECVKIKDSGAKAPVITRIETYHDDKMGKLRGNNTIHIMDFGGIKLAHFGDLGCRPGSGQMEQLKGLDIAIVPIGGFYTIDTAQAVELINELDPKLVIPMHFKNTDAGFGFDEISTADEFITTVGRIILTPCETLDIVSVERKNAIVMKPRNMICGGSKR